MITQLATIVYVAVIAGLFYLDRDAVSRNSKGLWIPVLWLLIIGSRPVSVWLQSGPTISAEQSYAEGNPTDATVFGCLIVAGLIVLAFRYTKVKRYLIANIPLLLFFGYCGLSIAWSDYSFIALKRWIKAIGDLVMVMIVLTDPDPELALKRLFSRNVFHIAAAFSTLHQVLPELGARLQ